MVFPSDVAVAGWDSGNNDTAISIDLKTAPLVVTVSCVPCGTGGRWYFFVLFAHF